MLKKSLISIIIIAVAVILISVGIHKYIQSTTTVAYGLIPGDQIPEQYEHVTYTIPIIDVEGNVGEQTFTVDNEKVDSTTVKLKIRNDKVKKHEFVEPKSVPADIQDKLPVENF